MPPSPELVARIGDLKRNLVAFAESRRFARHLDGALWEYLRENGRNDEGAVINAIDRFILQHRLPDGRTVLDVFVEKHPELSDEERGTLLGWHDVVEGLFEVKQRDGDTIVTTNLIDELTYRIRSNLGPSFLDRMVPGSFVLTRIVPLGDEWMLSGSSSLYPAEHRDEMYRVAASAAQQSPRLVFRNPEKLALGWELQRKERGYFVDFFGSDLVVLPGHELAARMQAYMHYRMFEARDAEGKTAAERSREVYGSEPAELDYGLTADLTDRETVGVMFDEVEGMTFLPDFGLLEEAFANPDLAARGRHRQVVLAYLKEPGTSPVPLRRLAERAPEQASRVFARLLKRPAFRWERDGDALLRHHQPGSYEQPPLPSIIPLGDTLPRATLGEPEPLARRRRAPTSRPGPAPTRRRRQRR